MATGTAVGGGLSGSDLICSSAVTVSGTGGAIIVFISYGATSLPTNITDGTNTYSLLDSYFDGTNGEQTGIYGAKNVAAGSYTPQTNGAPSPGDGVIVAIPLNGRDTTAPFGTPARQHDAPGTGADAITAPALTAVAGDDIVYMMVDVSALRNGSNFSAGTGFVSRGQFGNDSIAQLTAAAHAKDNVSAGSLTAVATQSNADTIVRFAVQVAAAAAPPTTAAEGGYTFFAMNQPQPANRIVFI